MFSITYHAIPLYMYTCKIMWHSKILMKAIWEQGQCLGSQSMHKNQYCQHDNSSQFDPWIQSSLKQNPSKLFYGYWWSNPNVYMKKQMIQNHKYVIDGEDQTWRTVTSDIKTYY